MDPQTSTPPRVLHFDDDDTVRMLMQNYLQTMNLEVMSTGSLEQARRELGRGDYDLLISDLDPGSGKPEDGLEFVEWVRRRQPDLPILVLTGHDSRSLVRKVRQTGVHDVVIKPNPITELETILREILPLNP